jgi:hypothetical protein
MAGNSGHELESIDSGDPMVPHLSEDEWVPGGYGEWDADPASADMPFENAYEEPQEDPEEAYQQHSRRREYTQEDYEMPFYPPPRTTDPGGFTAEELLGHQEMEIPISQLAELEALQEEEIDNLLSLSPSGDVNHYNFLPVVSREQLIPELQHQSELQLNGRIATTKIPIFDNNRPTPPEFHGNAVNAIDTWSIVLGDRGDGGLRMDAWSKRAFNTYRYSPFSGKDGKPLSSVLAMLSPDARTLHEHAIEGPQYQQLRARRVIGLWTSADVNPTDLIYVQPNLRALNQNVLKIDRGFASWHVGEVRDALLNMCGNNEDELQGALQEAKKGWRIALDTLLEIGGEPGYDYEDIEARAMHAANIDGRSLMERVRGLTKGNLLGMRIINRLVRNEDNREAFKRYAMVNAGEVHPDDEILMDAKLHKDQEDFFTGVNIIFGHKQRMTMHTRRQILAQQRGLGKIPYPIRAEINTFCEEDFIFFNALRSITEGRYSQQAQALAEKYGDPKSHDIEMEIRSPAVPAEIAPSKGIWFTDKGLWLHPHFHENSGLRGTFTYRSGQGMPVTSINGQLYIDKERPTTRPGIEGGLRELGWAVHGVISTEFGSTYENEVQFDILDLRKWDGSGVQNVHNMGMLVRDKTSLPANPTLSQLRRPKSEPEYYLVRSYNGDNEVHAELRDGEQIALLRSDDKTKVVPVEIDKISHFDSWVNAWLEENTQWYTKWRAENGYGSTDEIPREALINALPVQFSDSKREKYENSYMLEFNPTEEQVAELAKQGVVIDENTDPRKIIMTSAAIHDDILHMSYLENPEETGVNTTVMPIPINPWLAARQSEQDALDSTDDGDKNT